MQIKFLHSGSSGNFTLIKHDNINFAIDCGVSYKRIKEANNDKDVNVQHLFITHEHSDHISGAAVLYNKTGCKIYIHEASFNKRAYLFEKIPKEDIIFIKGGDKITLIENELEVQAFSSKHDSMACLGYVVKDLKNDKKFSFLTDTGYITLSIKEMIKDSNAYFIESDYDEEELEKYAEYDDDLKDRIRSPIGHLSNQTVLRYIKENINFLNTEFIALGHLSKRTNSPEILTKRIEEENLVNEKIHIIDEPKHFNL